MQNLMQIRCSTHSVILNATTTQYTCSLNSIYHPPLTSTVKLSVFTHVHSSPLSLAARLYQCCANCSHYINNGWTFSRPTSYTVIVTFAKCSRKESEESCRLQKWEQQIPDMPLGLLGILKRNKRKGIPNRERNRNKKKVVLLGNDKEMQETVRSQMQYFNPSSEFYRPKNKNEAKECQITQLKMENQILNLLLSDPCKIQCLAYLNKLHI